MAGIEVPKEKKEEGELRGDSERRISSEY